MTKVRIVVAAHEVEVEALASLPDVEAVAMRIYHDTRAEASRISFGYDVTNGRVDLAEVTGDVLRAP